MALFGLLKRMNSSDFYLKAHTNKKKWKKRDWQWRDVFIRSFIVDESNGCTFFKDFSKSMVSEDVKFETTPPPTLLKPFSFF